MKKKPCYSAKHLCSMLLTIPFRLRRKFYVAYNRMLFWMNDVRMGKDMLVYNKIYLKKNFVAKITIGDNFEFSSGEAINPLCRNIRGCLWAPFPNSEIVIGNNVGVSSACIWAKEQIRIGNNVNIGGDCIIMDTDAHNLDYRIRASNEQNSDGYGIDVITATSAPIVIGDDVLIGTRCIVLKGVTIGARSVIGAGSVVTKSVPEDCIAVGNPARVIKQLIVGK